MESVSPDCFYVERHQILFQVAFAMYEDGAKGIDVVMLANELLKRRELEAVGGPAYLNEIMAAVPHAAHADYYAKIVKDKWVLRRMLLACDETYREVWQESDEPERILERAEQRLFRIGETQQDGEIGISIILDEAFEEIFKRMDEGNDGVGVRTGFGRLDEKTQGFHAGELSILAARPSMGKTALVCNIAVSAADSGKSILMFSLEQSRSELAERLLCIKAKIHGQNLRKGDLDGGEQEALSRACERLRASRIHIDDRVGRTVPQMAAVARRVKRRRGLDLIVFDYLQLIEPEDKRIPREQQISSITRRLKFMSKDLGVPVIALSQLSRGVEQREDKRPRLSDLRESGAIEQDADIVMFLYRPEVYDRENRPGEADLIISKNRHGPTGDVELVWLRETLRFEPKASQVTVEMF